jgi:hypothetical protein
VASSAEMIRTIKKYTSPEYFNAKQGNI